MALIALLAFAFSFGNVWHLARMLNVPAWIAPLVGPAVGRAAVDAVAPLLLIGWAEVGPGLLRQIHATKSISTLRAQSPSPVALTFVPKPGSPTAALPESPGCPL
ncbi:hypothetical protein GCM10020216_030290 [Nonomuraea helvata]